MVKSRCVVVACIVVLIGSSSAVAVDGVPAHLKKIPLNQWVEFNPRKNAPIHCQLPGWERADFARCINSLVVWGGNH